MSPVRKGMPARAWGGRSRCILVMNRREDASGCCLLLYILSSPGFTSKEMRDESSSSLKPLWKCPHRHRKWLCVSRVIPINLGNRELAMYVWDLLGDR